VNIAAALVLAGLIMLGTGSAMLSAAWAPRDTGIAAPALPQALPVSEVLSEVQNPVSGPAQAESTADPLSREMGPATQVDLAPIRVRIPSLEIDAAVIDLGLNDDRTLEVPRDVAVTGWYTGRSVPGENGPSVVVGHVDSAIAGAGVFFNLGRLELGAVIEIERSDGSVAEFLVTELSLVKKGQFPTEEVYGPTKEPTLRLITCGGAFDQDAGSYLSNVIVYAQHRLNRTPPFPRS
jgi:sortase (surface protein transpeptidase)